jgi:hypothetical protein
VKYALHYDVAGAPDPIVRFDNHHGPHELHLGPRTFEIEFPGSKRWASVSVRHSRPQSATTGDPRPLPSGQVTS